MQKTKFKVKGIKCNSCAILIEDRLKNSAGIVKVKVDEHSNKGIVIFDEQKINEDAIYKIIDNIGEFKAEKMLENEMDVEETVDYKNPDSTATSKPPINSLLSSRPFMIVAVCALIIVGFMFFSKNSGGQIKSDSQNAVTQQQPAQASNNPQPQAAVAQNVVKNSNPALEAYVVARCPFGLQMQRVLADVIKNIPSLASNIKVRYIGSVSGNTITSMHGDAEAQENLRQICIREEQANKYWPYVSCQMQNGDISGCEKSTGVDSAKLSSCVSDTGRGIAYAAKDFALDSKYQIQGSPTLVLNGAQVSEFNFGGRTSDALKSVVCSAFDNRPGVCSQKLSTASAATSFSTTYN